MLVKLLLANIFLSFVLSFNDRPMIGIMTQDLDFEPSEILFPQGLDISNAKEYIAASYVKLIESAGARAVPIRYKTSKDELENLLSQLNGVLLPGGGVELLPGTPYYSAGQILWNYVKANPDYPLFGICLGFEWMASLIAENIGTNTLSGSFNASNLALNTKFTKHAKSSQLLRYVFEDQRLIKAMEEENVTFNEHVHGVTPAVFKQFPKLSENFDILATSVDSNGKEFVAAFEGNSNFPNVMAVQFHPEKNLFEWHPGSNFPKSNSAMKVSQSIINSFVERTRTNGNKFRGDIFDESKHVIETSQKVLFSGKSYFQELYLFYDETVPKPNLRIRLNID